VEGLAKIAASFDARRSKQYWQLLKRQYGGGDEAVNAMKQTGDTGIWHGTSAEAVPHIQEQGLKAGNVNHFGVGQYFGPKSMADNYATRPGREDPGLLRLRKPSELQGTKELYPVQNAIKVDVADPKQNFLLKNQAHAGADNYQRNLTKELDQANAEFMSVPTHRRNAMMKVHERKMGSSPLLDKITNNKQELSQVSGAIKDNFPALTANPGDKLSPDLQKYRVFGKSPAPYMGDEKTPHVLFSGTQPIKPELLKFPNGGM
jgi:hypothetical protein